MVVPLLVRFMVKFMAPAVMPIGLETVGLGHTSSENPCKIRVL